MTKEKWCEHIEGISGLIRPSISGDKIRWNEFVKSHYLNCPECKDRARTKRAVKYAKLTRHVYADMGLKRVIGAVSGRVYYE